MSAPTGQLSDNPFRPHPYILFRHPHIPVSLYPCVLYYVSYGYPTMVCLCCWCWCWCSHCYCCTYDHIKRSEFCGRMRPIQTMSFTSNSLSRSRVASNWKLLSTVRTQDAGHLAKTKRENQMGWAGGE